MPEEDLKALLEEDMSEEAVQEEKETEIMLDCNEKFNEVWVCFLVHTVWYTRVECMVCGLYTYMLTNMFEPLSVLGTG